MGATYTSQAAVTDHQKSKRIAQNTVVLFVRLFLVMVLNLYAVRVLLGPLGDDDYGTFNAVAGVVTALTCLTSVISMATQRFYSYTAGEGDTAKLQKVFSTSVNISIGLSVVALLLLETVGLWFVCHHLHIPVARMSAAILVYHFSVLTFICSLLQIPFMAAIITHEEMGTYALITSAECLLRLVVAFLVGMVALDHLAFYGGALMVVALLVLCTYVVIGTRRYEECSYCRVKDAALYKQLISFSGWTFFGALAAVFMIQGNTIILYEFFGALTTAAFAVAIQINHAFNSLTNSAVLSFRPAMIQSYAEGNMTFVDRLFYFGNKFLFFVLLAIAIPLIIEMEFVLNHWLGASHVTAQTILFSRLMIIYVVLLAMHHPITIVIYAIGKVKPYHLATESVTLLCLPISYLLFKMGMQASVAMVSMIAVTVCAHVVRLICIRRYYEAFSVWKYIRSFVIPAFVIGAVTVACAFGFYKTVSITYVRLACVFVLTPLILAVSSYLIGLTREERAFLKQSLFSFINKGK